jgi:ribosomal-protein-alanine N-acetyltransferase
VIDYAFGKFEVERIQAHTMAENSASTRVLEKLGMVKEGTARSALLHRGRFWDLHYFSILRGEWIAKAP